MFLVVIKPCPKSPIPLWTDSAEVLLSDDVHTELWEGLSVQSGGSRVREETAEQGDALLTSLAEAVHRA